MPVARINLVFMFILFSQVFLDISSSLVSFVMFILYLVMDVDGSSPTPRSGRKKKLSALSRLAAQRGKSNTPRQSLTGDGHGGTRGNEPIPKYPIDANVEIQNKEAHNEQEDSDEGIGMANSTYNSDYGSKMRQGANLEDSLLTSNGSTIKQLKHLKMDSLDNETGENSYPLKLKGEKRFRDTNSSGEELAADTGRINSRKYAHSASDIPSSEDLSTGETKAHRKCSGDQVGHGNGESEMEIDGEDLIGSPPKFLKNKGAATEDNIPKIRSKVTEKGPNRGMNSSQNDRLKKEERDYDFLSPNTRGEQVYDMDKTFTMRRDLNNTDVLNSQSLADKYRDVLADQEDNGTNNHEKTEMYDNLGDLRPGPGSSPPPPFNRNYSGSSLQASVLNSIDRPWSSMQRIPSGNTDVMSERSYQSTSVLPAISTKDVKDR